VSGMNDLITWLRAQLDDDERVARAASMAPWLRDEANASIRHSGPSASKSSESFGMYVIASVGAHDIGRPSHEDAEHIARWDPARVLAEIDAKRRILDMWADAQDAEFPNFEGGYAAALDDVVSRLALPYADRPGFRAEWRP
jgi:Family of unknown function (DUF6221)